MPEPLQASQASRPPSEALYAAVAFGMWGYRAAAFRVVELGTERYRPRPDLLLVSTHRAETDVPLLCPTFYRLGRYLQDRRAPRIHFAARDDMFDRGFFAGFPPGLSPRLRRLLYPLSAGGLLPAVRVHPVPYPSASVLRLGRALAELPPATPLEPLLPPGLAGELRDRARELGLAEPRAAEDVLRGEYADLMWRFLPGEELSDGAFAPILRRRAGEGASSLRALVEVIRSGEILLLFPEGRPSPDGTIGPLRKGLETLVRLGRPAAIQPLAIAYDELTCGRARAYVAFGEPFPPPAEGIDETTLLALRRTTPLTVGQVVASALIAAASAGAERLAPDELDRRLAAEVASARAEGRPVEPGLADPATRRARLADACRWACRRRLATARSRRELSLAAAAVLADGRLRRAAAEHASARELAP